MSKKTNVIISGGGSGGHIYPALAVADELVGMDENIEVILVGAKRGLEKKIFSESRYRSYFLPVGQLHSSVGRLKQIWSLLRLPYCFLISLFLIIKYRPKAVLGVGGYASGPLCMVAYFLNTHVYIWEGNATPGITNRLLGRFKVTPFLVFQEASRHFKKATAIFTGVPVRSDLENTNDKNAEESDPDLFTLLFVGGSQGARVFNTVLPELVKSHDLSGIKIIHQTGNKNFDEVQRAYGQNYDNVEVLAYLDPIRDYYEKADLVVSRAGAGAVNELSLLAKPSLLVPFPKASDDHQKKNAESLEAQKAAVMIEEKDFTAKILFEKIEELKNDESQRKLLSQNIQKALKKGARQEIARHIYNQVNRGRTS